MFLASEVNNGTEMEQKKMVPWRSFRVVVSESVCDAENLGVKFVLQKKTVHTATLDQLTPSILLTAPLTLNWQDGRCSYAPTKTSD